MTTRSWIGATGGAWFADASWDPSGVPVAGDEAIVSKGSASVGSSLSVDNVQIALGSGSFAQPSHITLNGGTIGATTSIEVGRGLPYAGLVLKAGGVFDGAAHVVGGQLSYFADAGSSGSGTITVAKGGSVDIEGTGTAMPSISFMDDNGTVILNDPTAFDGTISGLRTGDRIEFGHGFTIASVSYVGSQMTLFDVAGSLVATLDVMAQGLAPTLYAVPFGHVASAILTSQASRAWGGSVGGDWYDAANWTTGVPVGGDTASIVSGTATITAADAAAVGTMDFQTVQLGAAGSTTPVTLRATDASFGPAFNLLALGTPQYTPSHIVPQATFEAIGLTRFQGNLAATSHGGTLTVEIASNGTEANLELVGHPGTADSDVFAEAFAGQESVLVFAGSGTLTNNGVVLVDGSARFGNDIVVQGSGTIEIEAGGTVTIDGAVAGTQTVLFGDETGTLILDDIASFQGQVVLYGGPGNQIDVSGVNATSLAYDGSTHALKLLDGAGKSVGAITVSSDLGLTAADFSLSGDGTGGSLLGYAPLGPATERQSLPVAAVGTTAATVPLSSLLTQAFGAVPSAAGYSEYILSAPQPNLPTESYWQQGPFQPTNSQWLYKGNPIEHAVSVAAGDIGDYALLIGNSIVRTAWFTVPNAVNAGTISHYIQYNIWTVDPAVDTQTGTVTPGDIVASAQRYDTVYNGVLNYNNCNWIADNLTAGVGAVMPFANASTDPTDNQEGGFWRIVYRGSDSPSPPMNWFPLTQPGDVVRMGHIDGGGQHTTTVIGSVNPDGTVTVYDNGDRNSQGQNIIGIHDATYWTGMNPASITIYRLDPNQQYLITGTALGEYLQGSVFNDLIRPAGGVDTVVGGPGDNEVQGVFQDLDGISVVDFDAGDSIDLTNLALGTVTAHYDSATGLLDIETAGSNVATIGLPAGLSSPFLQRADAGGGTVIELACFAEGTRIAAPGGAIAVQHLACGDRVLTAAGEDLPVQWVGHRTVNCARHPRPQQVLPVRIAAGSFGPNVPSRDLLLSPDHAVFTEGVLVPVKYLIDGNAIVQLTVDEASMITYWHVELARHTALLAEDLPVESFLDGGGRSNFANAGETIIAHPDFSVRAWEAYGFAPLCVTGPTLAAIRSRLRSRRAQVADGRGQGFAVCVASSCAPRVVRRRV